MNPIIFCVPSVVSLPSLFPSPALFLLSLNSSWSKSSAMRLLLHLYLLEFHLLITSMAPRPSGTKTFTGHPEMLTLLRLSTLTSAQRQVFILCPCRPPGLAGCCKLLEKCQNGTVLGCKLCKRYVLCEIRCLEDVSG